MHGFAGYAFMAPWMPLRILLVPALIAYLYRRTRSWSAADAR